MRRNKDIFKSVVDGEVEFKDLDDKAKEAVWKYVRWRMKWVQLYYFFRVMKDFFVIVGIIIIVLLAIQTFLLLTGN